MEKFIVNAKNSLNYFPYTMIYRCILRINHCTFPTSQQSMVRSMWVLEKYVRQIYSHGNL